MSFTGNVREPPVIPVSQFPIKGEIERVFRRLKAFCEICIRYDKHKRGFTTFIRPVFESLCVM
jgi:hypothetical protein